MTTEAIIESGMTFGPYPAGQCFYIEKSACYSKIQEEVQIAEFLLLQNKCELSSVVWVVEAKSSSPRPGTQPNFAEFIEAIRNKLTNGFLLGMAMRLGRHPNGLAELPEPFQKLDLRTASFRFVLVIKGHKEEWLPPLQEALSLVLKPIVKSWALPPTSVVVLNECGAQLHGLVLPVAKTAALC
ncbi:hypothetical protein [Candidatus Symbiobacter mobilis]|uniref:Uncharacterized protein n=1 Tax=Candidatus Symbiobacter mobilis CR TaxID=946483 RepID=U5NEE6_9BURK|nr:hypothetical protein [Candidatus Symbiobacter mobilis]AGX88598.1 hypothetical protein Cenrod_2544 [Candidatus Symbiobacter mobilis CR]